MYAVRCARTGLYFPADYFEQWGRLYGKQGLGIKPVSETLVNDYLAPVCRNKNIRLTMRPFGYSYSQVDVVQIPEEEFNLRKAVLDVDDIELTVRGKIMRERQILHDVEMQSYFPTEYTEIKEKNDEHEARLREIRQKYVESFI